MTILEPQAVPDAPGPRLLTPGPASGPAPGSASSQGSGPRLAPDVTEPSSLWVVPLPDPLVEAFGFDPRSWYVERFWLPVIGPPSTELGPIGRRPSSEGNRAVGEGSGAL